MPSHFIWYELLTPDVEASQRFYTAVVGWAVNPSHHAAASHYRHLTAPDGESVGGMLQLTEQMTAGGARPVWLGSMSVVLTGDDERVIRLAPEIATLPEPDRRLSRRRQWCVDAAGMPIGPAVFVAQRGRCVWRAT